MCLKVKLTQSLQIRASITVLDRLRAGAGKEELLEGTYDTGPLLRLLNCLVGPYEYVILNLCSSRVQLPHSVMETELGRPADGSRVRVCAHVQDGPRSFINHPRPRTCRPTSWSAVPIRWGSHSPDLLCWKSWGSWLSRRWSHCPHSRRRAGNHTVGLWGHCLQPADP